MRYDFITTTYLPGLGNAAAQAASGHADGLVGSWTPEVGTLNQTVEIWSKPRPEPTDGTPLDREAWTLTGIVGPKPPESASIYEMRHYRLRPGITSAWVEIFTAALPEREKLSRIVGLFASDPGEPDRVVHIWAYPDLNTRAAVRAKAMQDPAWKDFLGKSRAGQMVVRQEVSILLPAAHSPLK